MSVVRAAIRGFGELLITAGIVLMLFVVYQLYWTGVGANRAMDQARQQLEQQWQSGSDLPAPTGEAFALMYVPRFGSDWGSKPIFEGIDPLTLRKGLGHYTGTAMPGELGNFAVAGHRTTYGQPFHNADDLEPGNSIYVRTRDTWYEYRVRSQEIVSPDALDVTWAVPQVRNSRPTKRLLTLTTCHPKFSDRQRLIVYAELESTRNVSDGPPPGLVSGKA